MDIPIFAVEGSSWLLQNTSEVTKTDHLGSNYLLFATFDYRTEEHGTAEYQSVGSILSIHNFQD